MTELLVPAEAQDTAPSLTAGFADGENYLRLHFNESPYGPPAGALKAAAAELEGRPGAYPDPECRALRGRIAAELGISPDMVAVANGVDEMILLTCLTFGSRGSGVAALSERTFPGYATSATVAGLAVRPVPMPGYEIPVSGFAQALREQADLAIICSPHNPTGAVVSPDDVREIIGAARAGGGIAVFDEAYTEYADQRPETALAAVRAGERVLVYRTFSKAWGLAGLRVGYAVGPAELIGQLEATRRSLPFDVNRVAQAAALAALDSPGHIAEVRERNAAARDRLAAAVSRLGATCAPSQSNFVLVDLGRPSGPVTTELARCHQVLVRDLDPLGFPGCLRVTVGTEQQVDQFAAALADVLVPAGPAAAEPETEVASAIGPAVLFNGYIGMQVFYALHELGVVRQLEDGPVPMTRLAPAADRERLGALLRIMTLLGYVAHDGVGGEPRDGAIIQLTRLGRDLVRQQGYMTWCAGGHGPIWSSLDVLTAGSARYGTDVRRNDSRVAIGSGEADRLIMRPIQDAVCASIDFSSVADIGCGDGSRLLRMCAGDQPRRGIGIDISQAACELAVRKVAEQGVAERVEIVQADILQLLGRRTFPGIDLAMSIFMLHDLFAAQPDHELLIRSLRGSFPDARYFLLADTTRQPGYPAGEELPVFSLGFELAHTFMGVPLQTRETYEEAFTAGGLRLLNCVPFGAPATWLFLLEAE